MIRMGSGSSVLWGWALGACLGAAFGGAEARAGGGPENVLLVIDPTKPESMYVGNHYKQARNIPDRNVLYMGAGAEDYASWKAFQLDAIIGTLADRGLNDHIDYIVIAPGPGFYVPPPGSNGIGYCFETYPRLSLSSVYTLGHYAEDILAKNWSIEDPNHYFAEEDAAKAFDHSVHWFKGKKRLVPGSRRYWIGFMLGYSGQRGNTSAETIAMIDRSVASDGVRPSGTFYFMKVLNDGRSWLRDSEYPAVVDAIRMLGGQAEEIVGTNPLPAGRHDCLGIMTGAAWPAITETDMTILPGAFCDHLTSWAGMFDCTQHVKSSRWLVPAAGASGSMGMVVEPFSRSGKFPHPRLHLWYFQGLSLGEALLRSTRYVPAEGLFYGDPLTRPFAYVPTVTVPNLPTMPVEGTLVLHPEAATQHPTAGIARYDLYADGVKVSSARSEDDLAADTGNWPDGPHDLRVVAYEDSPVESQGRWVGTVETANHGRSVNLRVDPSEGDLGTSFDFAVAATGSAVSEIRLISNGRVTAATRTVPDTLRLLGQDLGGGTVRVQAVVEYVDGRFAVSDGLQVSVAFANPPTGSGESQAPAAFSFRKHMSCNHPVLVELPATDADGSVLSYTIHDAPTQAVIAVNGPMCLVTPFPQAGGEDIMTFSVSDGILESQIATITLLYGSSEGIIRDCNGNGLPDACDGTEDCNSNDVPDECDLADGTSLDCDGNLLPDECDIAEGRVADCNENGIPDPCDISAGTSNDCDGNAIPDECDIASGTSQDCDGNGVPDGCDISEGTSPDCNENGVPDACDVESGASRDCNGNGVPDACDLASASGRDCNGNGVLDECDVRGPISFGEARSIPTVSTGICSVTAEDLDGDGYVDLAATMDDAVLVLLNDGVGGFREARRVAVGGLAAGITAARLDSNDAVDLVVAKPWLSSVSVLLNDGTGGFEDVGDFAAGGWPVSVAAGRLSGDDRVSLAVINSTSNSVSVLYNDGNGSFGEAQSVAVGNEPVDAILADLNRDGRMDMAVACSWDGTVCILLQDEGGSFGAPATPACAVGAGPFSIAAGDLNADGEIDLVTANRESGTLSLLFNSGKSEGTWLGFAPATDIRPNGGGNPLSVTLGDVDHDGDPDLVVLQGPTADFSVLLNDGHGAFPESMTVRIPVRSPIGIPSKIALGHLDDKNRTDVLVAASSDASLWIVPAEARRRDCSRNGIPDECDPGSVLADLNEDGDVDGFDFLTWALCYNGPNRPVVSQCTHECADLDGDSDVDGVDFLTFAGCYNGSDRPPRCP